MLPSAQDVKGSTPAGVAEKVRHDVDEECGALSNADFVYLIFGRFERPVDEKRTPQNILFRDESPVAAVEAVGAVIAHGEVMAGRNDYVSVFDVRGQCDGPGWGYALGF